MDFAIPQIRVQQGFVAPASRRHFLRHAEGEEKRQLLSPAAEQVVSLPLSRIIVKNRVKIRTMSRKVTAIGLISDTHGLLRQEALHALEGSELIIHAGDVGNSEIIDTLKAIAPVFAVRGNVDTESWASALPETEVVITGTATIYVLHDVHALDLNPAAAGFQIVVSGHSHKPARMDSGGVLYINPGSAGPRRFQLPVTIARLDLAQTPWKVDFINLCSTSIKD
jgi:putative phosphoesterase